MNAPLLEEKVEALAEALFAVEYGAHSPAAHPDHNRWTWRGDGLSDAERAEFRERAQALAPLVAGWLADAEQRGRDQIDPARGSAYEGGWIDGEAAGYDRGRTEAGAAIEAEAEDRAYSLEERAGMYMAARIARTPAETDRPEGASA